MEKRYQNEEERKELAQRIAAESFVLLKNVEKTLPLKGGKAAVFGKAAYEPVISGSGSGDAGRGKNVRTLPDCLREHGVHPVEVLDAYYRGVCAAQEKHDELGDFLKKMGDLVASGMIYEFFGRYNAQPEEIPVEDSLIALAAEEADTAVYVLGRATGGEECDRRLENDYYLLESEKRLIRKLGEAFSKVIVVLNINGPVDLMPFEAVPAVRAILFAGCPGEQGSAAIADVLTGAVNPSGKLSFTFARNYADYPSARDFSCNKDDPDSILEYADYGLDAEANGSRGFDKSPVTVYREDIYPGYRYFDTFGVEPLYPFGYGLSYTTFSVLDVRAERTAAGFAVTASVHNDGNVPGRSPFQVYVCKAYGKNGAAAKELAGIAKTGEIEPGAEEKVRVEIPLDAFAAYDAAAESYVIEAGTAKIFAGIGSTALVCAAVISVPEPLFGEKLHRALPLASANEGKIDFLRAPERMPEDDLEADFVLESAELTAPVSAPRLHETAGKAGTLAQVKAGELSMEDFLSGLSNEELAVLCNGYGPGLPFGGMGSKAPSTIQYPDGSDIGIRTHRTGMPGYISPGIERAGIRSACYKDGPAGVGMTAWPTGMLIACSFDPCLAAEFGAACGTEADLLSVDSWLGPALNLHRNPLGGRNFEYFSEDPYLTGAMGLAITEGAAGNCSTTCCPKHFAVNEQETYRRGSLRKKIDADDSILTERALREIYLKPFEMVIRGGKVRTLMTAFNKINGTFAGGSHDLNTTILRGEWGYEGVVVTDWGDMDIVVDGADAVAAGNDVVMPGGPPVIAQVLQGLAEQRVAREDMINAAAHLMNFVMNSASFEEDGE